jgi:predicted permease
MRGGAVMPLALLRDLLADLRFGARLLLRAPGFALVSVLALGLGIGGATTMFSAVHAVLLRPLPFFEPERLVAIWESAPAFRFGSVSGPNFSDWRRDSTAWQTLAAIGIDALTLTGDGAPESLVGARVSQDFFAVFGAQTQIGRTFIPEEQQPGSKHVALLGDALWRRRYGADPTMVGRTVEIGGVPHTVVGVLAPDFRVPMLIATTRDLFVPLGRESLERSRGNHRYLVFGRLRDGTTLDSARAELETIAARLAMQYPDEQAGRGVVLHDMHEQVTRRARPVLSLLMGAVLLVLVIACANVAGLLLARGDARQGELAVRRALGATGPRLMRQLLSESLLLGGLGGALGLLVSLWGTDLIRIGLADQLGDDVDMSVDGVVLGFALAASIASAVLVGVWPALLAARTSVQAALKEGAARATVGASRARARRVLVAVELALSLTLVAGAGLTTRSLAALARVDPGFDPDHVLVAHISLPETKYQSPEQVEAFYAALLARVRTLPGAASAGVINSLPLSRSNTNGDFEIVGRDPFPRDRAPTTEHVSVSPDLFSTLGMHIIAGRGLTDEDRRGAQPVAVINQSMATRYWPNESPLGRQLKIDWASDAPLTIVGVAAAAKRWDLGNDELVNETYVPMAQVPQARMALLVKTSVPPLALAGAVRAAVAAVDPAQPIMKVSTMQAVVDDSLAQRRFTATLLTAFGVFALALSALGVYGLMAFQVSRRQRELAIRAALGATGADIKRLVLGEGARLVAAGIAVGLLGGLALARTMSSFLYGVPVWDPPTFAGAAVVLTMAALVACWFPARRAARTLPMAALRDG